MPRILVTIVLLLCITGCTQVQLASHVTKQVLPPTKSQGTFKVGTPYKIEGERYYPQESYDLTETGIASWYGPQFHGKNTANGETFDMYELTAAHRTLQMPSLVRVTNLENGRSLIVRVNDRGPYKKGRIIDVSQKAAELLGFREKGTAKVRIDVLKEESLMIAEVAKSGKDTSGFEVALNQGGKLPYDEGGGKVVNVAYQQPQNVQPAAGAPVRQPGAVSREVLVSSSGSGPLRQAIPGHTRNGAFYPDPIITEMPVVPSNIFVQAGAFTVPENAYRLREQLSHFAESQIFPATINGRQFYRVRLGPVADVAQADALLAQVVSAGQENAIIIVD